MKKIIYTLVVAFAAACSMNAQTDRSVQPEPGPAPTINLKKPQSFKMENGLTVLVVEDHKLPRVTFSLTLDNPPYLEGDKKGVSALTSSVMGKGTQRMSKDQFNELVDFYGASLSIGINGASGYSLSRFFPQLLELAAQGSLEPLFTQEELDDERNKILDVLKADEKNVPAIASRVNNILLYGRNHPNGEYMTEESVMRVTLDDVKSCYFNYFVPENAYLVIVGDVQFDDVKSLVTKNFSFWRKASPPKSVYTEPMNPPRIEINFVDAPNAVQTEIYVSNITDLKMTSPDYFAALMANQILGGGMTGRLFKNLRETYGWTYGAYSGMRAGKYTSSFAVQSSVKSAATDSAVVEILRELKEIRETMPTQQDLDMAKARYVGNFVMNAEKPSTIAGFALQERTRNLPDGFFENYIKSVNAVTLEQVRQAARKYMNHDNTRVVVVGNAGDFLNNLEKLDYPIYDYDDYGNMVKHEIIEIEAVD